MNKVKTHSINRVSRARSTEEIIEFLQTALPELTVPLTEGGLGVHSATLAECSEDGKFNCVIHVTRSPERARALAQILMAIDDF